MPSMSEAAKIRDVAARHAYVFDNGLCSPDFFDVEKRMQSEEFCLLRDRIFSDESVLEIGCFTGLNLMGLRRYGRSGQFTGIEFVRSATMWMLERDATIGVIHGEFPTHRPSNCTYDNVVCFDVLEHQLNVGEFLKVANSVLRPTGRALFLVPLGKEYNDCGHVAWFPDAECLRNVLEYFFNVDQVFELKSSKKMFASCSRLR